MSLKSFYSVALYVDIKNLGVSKGQGLAFARLTFAPPTWNIRLLLSLHPSQGDEDEKLLFRNAWDHIFMNYRLHPINNDRNSKRSNWDRSWMPMTNYGNDGPWLLVRLVKTWNSKRPDLTSKLGFVSYSLLCKIRNLRQLSGFLSPGTKSSNQSSNACTCRDNGAGQSLPMNPPMHVAPAATPVTVLDANPAAPTLWHTTIRAF